MNDANAPLNNLDFPNVMSPDAVRRQVSYSQQSELPSTIEGANVDALINLVQDLNQKNHDLLNRITVLEGEVTTHKATMQQKGDRSSASSFAFDIEEEVDTGDPDGLGASLSSADTFSADHVSHLLNQLEFAQQANQRQDIRVESLSTQLTSCQSQVEQLEAENSDLQQRCGNQLYRLNHLEEECRDLRLRLQRQQRYTLQFKAALEKCLEVPPPSYGFFHSRDYDHDMVEPFPPSPDAVPGSTSTEFDSADERDEEGNWLVQPLFPKVRSIKPWGDSKSQTTQSDIDQDVTCSSGKSSPLISHNDWSHDQGAELPSPSSISFPGDRFQSTLLTLANEAQDREAQDREGISLNSGSEAESFQIDDQSSGAMALALEHQEEIEKLSDHLSASGQGVPIEQEHSAPVIEPPMVEQSVVEPPVVEPPVKSMDAIAPFSSEAFSDSEPNPTDSSHPSALGSGGDKLWQSLVSLIDISAADGLNTEALPLHHSSSDRSAPLPEEMPLPQRTASSPLKAWTDGGVQADECLTGEQPNSVSSVSVQNDSPPPPVSSQMTEQADHSSASAQDTVTAPTTAASMMSAISEGIGAQKPVKRAIELPSFLNPGNGINPNPA